MKFNNFASFVRKQTKTDSTSFSNNDLVLFSNIAKDYIAEEVVQIDEDYFDIILTTNLVADQREYSFPVDMLKNMKMIEMNLLTQDDIDFNVANPSATQIEKWKRLEEFDLNSFERRQDRTTKKYSVTDINSSFSDATTNEENIVDTFSDATPAFDIDGEAIFIYNATAIIALTSGLKLRAIIYPLDYTTADFATSAEMSIRSSNTTTAMPRSSLEVLAIKTILLFKKANQMSLDSFDLAFFSELEIMKNKLRSPNLDRVITPTVQRSTGFEY